ncbi:hypothetical protein TNCV_3100451 [Trichonephila clavipes]|nr:hypothetical protein TNCV_3100451 [Trichonephila clavipes]
MSGERIGQDNRLTTSVSWLAGCGLAHGDVHQDAALKAETRLKRRRSTTPVSSFEVAQTSVIARLYAAVSKGEAMIIIVQTVRAAPHVVELSMGYSTCCTTS